MHQTLKKKTRNCGFILQLFLGSFILTLLNCFPSFCFYLLSGFPKKGKHKEESTIPFILVHKSMLGFAEPVVLSM